MSLQSRRLVRDSALSVTKALPAANANSNSGTLDLGAGPFHTEELDVEISIPALANLVDAHAVTIKLQDSADDAAYADVDPLIQTTVTGAGGVGCAAKVVTFRLPPGVRRYIQFNAAVANGGGDNTASSITYSLLV
jgi:hypothetical protein